METILGYCAHHGITEFVQRGKNKRKLICKLCEQESVSKRRRLMKEILIKYKGGKCEKCGYDKNLNALEFHHLNPSEKEFSISSKLLSIEALKKETDKCVLLCANCHRELHDELIRKEREDKENFYKEKAKEDLTLIQNGDIKIEHFKLTKLDSSTISSEEIYNKHYKENISLSDLSKQYNCSISTIKRKIKKYKEINPNLDIKRKIIIKPSKKELYKLILSKPFVQIGNLYNVSDNAIRKWCKSYNLPYRKKDINKLLTNNKELN